MRTYKDVRKDYTFDDGIFCDEPDRIHKVKDIVLNRINEVDRTLILLYADCQSYRKLGARLGMSHMTIRSEIMRIRKDIVQQYERI